MVTSFTEIGGMDSRTAAGIGEQIYFWTLSLLFEALWVMEMEITNTYLDSFFLCEGKRFKVYSGHAKSTDFRSSLLLTSSACPVATLELQDRTKAFSYFVSNEALFHDHKFTLAHDRKFGNSLEYKG